MRRNLGGFVVILIIVLLTSCSKFRTRSEDFFIEYAKETLREEIEILQTREICHYNFEVEKPKIVALEPDSWMLATHSGWRRDGFYDQRSGTIYYNRDRLKDTIPHEVFHHIKRNGIVSLHCLEETSATLLGRVVELDLDNRSLRRRLDLAERRLRRARH